VTLESLIPALVILPLAGFSFTALVGRRLGRQAHWVPVVAILLVWVIAMALVFEVLTEAAPLLPGSDTIHGYEFHLFTWIPAGEFQVDAAMYIDPLTACLLIVVTTIGTRPAPNSRPPHLSPARRPTGYAPRPA